MPDNNKISPRWRTLRSTLGLGQALLQDILSRLHYCKRDLEEFRIQEQDPRIEYIPRSGRDIHQVEEVLNDVVACIKAGYVHCEPRVSFTTGGRGKELYTTAIADLKSTGEIHFCGSGLVALSGRPLALKQALERIFETTALKVGASPQSYPNLISTEVLKRCGYFSSFPQYLTFACHLREDLDTLRAFAGRMKADPNSPLHSFESMAAPEEVLSPTVCFHCFETLQDRHLAKGPLTILTACNQCYRYEAGNLHGLERLWDFTMREIVLFGAPQLVKEGLAQIRAEVEDLVVELGLESHIESATDAFFIDDFASKSAFQNTFDLKQELRLPVPGGTLAAASFNYHGDLFCKSFKIDQEHGSSQTVSACVGFGLERFVAGVLAQKGIEVSGWPELIRETMERHSAPAL